MGKLETTDDARTLGTLRAVLLGLFLFGSAGTLAELLLLAHDEDALQLIPVVLLGAGLLVGGWNGVARSRVSLRMLQMVLLAFVASGVVGAYLHYEANVEFQRELEPSIAGTALLWKVLHAKSPPALSPGVMVQLGLLGLAYSFRHPAVSRGVQGDGG